MDCRHSAWRLGTHQAEERDINAIAAIVEKPFIQQGQQGIQNGAVRFEDLIHEGNLSGRQVAADFALVQVVLQACKKVRCLLSGLDLCGHLRPQPL